MELQTLSSLVDNEIECGLCGKEKAVKWLCHQCSIKLCDSCKIIHSNTKLSIRHKITCFWIDDKDLDICSPELKRRIQKLQCNKHPTQHFSGSCGSCHYVLVCDNCILGDHSCHNILTLDQYIHRTNQDINQEVPDQFPRGLLAHCSNREDNVVLYSSEFRLLHKVVTKMSRIHDIKTVSYLSAWCGGIDTPKLKIPIKSRKFCVKYLYHKMNKDIECNLLDMVEGFNAIDMAIKGQELWFVTKHEPNLKWMFTDNYNQRVIKNLIHFEQQEPISIHLDERNNLFWVGLKESGPDEIKPSSVRKLEAYNIHSWNLEREFERSTSGKRLFTVPLKIKSISDQIVVIDKTSEKSGRVVSLDYFGHRKWDYCQVHGHGAMQKPFFPTSIAITADNRIVVTDSANSSIHILNSSGKIIAFKLTTDFGLERPYSLDIDEHGSLWIGNRSCSESQNAQICVVKMTIK